MRYKPEKKKKIKNYENSFFHDCLKKVFLEYEIGAVVFFSKNVRNNVTLECTKSFDDVFTVELKIPWKGGCSAFFYCYDEFVHFISEWCFFYELTHLRVFKEARNDFFEQYDLT